MRTGIYARISQDVAGDSLGVNRQVQDCRRLIEDRGWVEVSTYIDNDVSATRSRRRPEFERMMADIDSGHLQAICVWDIDRLTRTPRELEDIIDLAEKHSLKLANVSGEVDLSTSDGRLHARLKGIIARQEVEQQSKRLKRKFLEKAEKGQPHGYTPYGYERIPGDEPSGIKRDIARADQAAIVQEVADRVLAGESLRSIVTDLNQRGVPGPKSPTWNSTILRQILLRPTNAGLRSYRGRVIGPSTSEPILAVETHERLTYLLRDPLRRSNHVGPTPKYLLSGIAVCGLCGAKMRRQIGRVNRNRVNGNEKRQPPSYQCGDCYRVRRKQDAVDKVVTETIVRRLSKDDVLDLMAPPTKSDIEDLVAIEAIDARLGLVADQLVEDLITNEQFLRITKRLRTERDQLSRARLVSQRSSLVGRVAGPDARSRWQALTIGTQREIVETLMTVTVFPARSGMKFDPTLIRIDWKQ